MHGKRESSAGLYLALGILVLGALAATVFFAPLADCPECQGQGLRLSSTGGIMGQYRPRCVACQGKGMRTIASIWPGRR